MRETTSYSRPEHLGDPYMGAWYVPGLIHQDTATAVMGEVYDNGNIEPIRETKSRVNQLFERVVIDLTREHDYPLLDGLGMQLGRYLVNSTAHKFPNLRDYSIDEAAVQIYPPDTDLALGWHMDHELDSLAVISAVLSGSGEIGFTHKQPHEEISEGDICMRALTGTLGVMYFRAKGLYEREDGSDIRETHAVTKVIGPDSRFSIQFRMGVNAGDYGNVHVNHDRPLRNDRVPIAA